MYLCRSMFTPTGIGSLIWENYKNCSNYVETLLITLAINYKKFTYKLILNFHIYFYFILAFQNC